MLKICGIANCDTVKKARRWLDANGVAYQFHDFRKDGLEADTLDRWIKQAGWETLLNRRGTTWHKLPEATRDAIDEQSARDLMLDHPTLIKRPVVDDDSSTRTGFNEAAWQQRFLSAES